MSSTFPFKDDVLQVLELLLQGSSAAAIREAILADEVIVAAFANAADEPSSAVYMALCEFGSGGGDDAADKISLIATTNPSFYLAAQRSAPNSNSNTQIPLSCVVINKRHASAVAPLSVKDLALQSVDVSKPLESLQSLLQNIFEPLFRSEPRYNKQSLRVQMHDLISGIRSLHNVLPDVNILRFVPDDLVELCAMHPGMDLKQLVDRLGDQAKDPSYLRRVLQVRNRCATVLPLDDLLSGRIQEDDEEEEGEHTGNNSAVAGDNAQRSSGWVVQERVAFWQNVHLWVTDVYRQLQCVEWRLVQHLLGSQVKTSFVPEYVRYAERVRGYIKYLQAIPEKLLLTVKDDKQFSELVDELFSAVMRSSNFPPQLVLRMLDPLVSEMASCWVHLVNKKQILLYVNSSSNSAPLIPTGGGGASASTTLTTTGAAAAGSSSSPQRSLQELRASMEMLALLQERYAHSVAALRSNRHQLALGDPAALSAAYRSMTVSSAAQPLTHCRLEALHRRCLQVRDWIEQHYLLSAQLSNAFSSSSSRPKSKSSLAQSSAAMTSRQELTASSHFEPTDEIAAALENMFNGCVRAVCEGTDAPAEADGFSGGSSSGAATPQGVGLSGSSVLWDTTSGGQRRFDAALEAYNHYVNQCDERVSVYISSLLSAQHNVGSEGSGGIGELNDAGQHRLYSIFSSYRYMSLSKVQRVVQGYESTLAEKVIAHAKVLQEEFFSVSASKRETRLGAALFHFSPPMSTIVWDTRLEAALRQCIVRHDYVNEKGWNRVLSLRNIEHYWRLNDALAEVFGFPLPDLITKELHAESCVHGCAYALAFLHLFHPEDEPEWSADPHIKTAQALVQSHDPSSFQAARERLMVIGTGALHRTRRAEMQDIRSTLHSMRRRLEGKVASWCESTRNQLGMLSLHPNSMTLQDCLLRVGGMPPHGSPSVSRSPSVASPSSPQRQPAGSVGAIWLEVSFPFKQFMTVAEDFRYADSVGLLESNDLLADVSFLKDVIGANEGRVHLAQCLSCVIEVYYVTVNQEDSTLVMLASDEYKDVNECFQRGFTLTWNDNESTLVQYVQQLCERVQAFTQAALEVREKTEAVRGKIAAFHTRAFHPETIIQRVKEIRLAVNALSLRCVHTYLWVRDVQPLLDAALREQIKFLLHGWTLDFASMRNDLRFLNRDAETDVFGLKPLRVRMCVARREVRLETPAAAWRSHWIGQLSRYLSWVDVLPPLYKEEDAVMVSSPLLFNDLKQYQRGGQGGYAHLLELIPSAALAEPLKAIEQCIAETIAVEDQWRQSQHFLNLDVAVMQQRFGTDLARWSSALLVMQGVAAQLMDVTQPNKLVGGIVVLAEDAQVELGRKLDQVSQYTHTKFKDVLEKELERTFESITTTMSTLEGLDVLSDVKDAASFMCGVPKAKQDIAECDRLVGLMVDSEAALQRLGYVLPDHWTSAAKVKEELVSLKDLMDRRLKALQFRRPALMQATEDEAAAVEGKAKHLQQEFDSLDSTMTRTAPTSAQDSVSDLHRRITELYGEAQRVSAIQESLGVAPMSTSAIQRLMASTESLRDVWAHVTKAFARLNLIGAAPFFEVVPRRLHEELKQVEEDVAGYPEVIHSFPIYKELETLLRRRIGYRRLIQDLRSDAMSPLEKAQRHWITLKQQLHAPWALEKLTVQDIWNSDPVAHAAIYNEVLETAQGERRIEVQLHRIAAYWESFVFSLVVYKKQVALIRGWDAVFEKLADDLSTFGGIRASPYFSSTAMVTMTNDAEAQLHRLRQVLEALLEVQRRWVYLDGVFTGNAEIRQQLPHDTVLFDRTTRELLPIFPSMRSGQMMEVRAKYFLEDEKLLTTLERLLGQLVSVQRALTTFLDTQRSRFPRFFFVGDDDLLEMLGNSQDPTFIAKHLRKLFTALAGLSMDANATSLLGFTSMEGEAIRYEKPVSFKQRALYDWLRDVQDGMVATLRRRTIEANQKLLSNNGAVSLDWISEFPAQMVCIALQLQWVRLQEKQFASLTTTMDRQRQSSSASPATEEMDKTLAGLANMLLDAGLATAMRHKCEQLVTVAVYQRDVSRSLTHKGVVSVGDFEWVSVLRVYLTGAEEGEEKDRRQQQQHGGEDVACRMADATLRHGFEYIGAYERLVQTPLTDKCYLTLMQALHTRMGGSPVGPAGTGKTESVKALGMQLGRHVLVFNCDDTFDFQAVSRIFLGLCQVGAWGCFDEFNRLEERILSALSQQIQIIQESLRVRKTHIELNEHTVPLHDNVGIFVTMNPGYAGRSKLPGNLTQLFRAVTMTVPDRETIAEVMLFAQGFHTAEQLSRKVVPLFKLCEDQFSRQAHYDFGLRALKSVLVAAGELKRRAAVSVAGAAKHVDNADATTALENSLMLESIIVSIAPKLVKQDASLFYPLLHDFFPDCDMPRQPLVELREAIAEVCALSGLFPAPDWVEKICELHHTIDARHGIMLVGSSGVGKTTAWKTLLAAMVRTNPSLEMHAYVIDPKVLTKAELFGNLDVTTREWTDGVFTSILRKIIEAEQQAKDRAAAVAAGDATPPPPTSSPPTSKSYWAVFDGDVDPEWVENLNSVLDDNKVLTLPNGERLPLPKSMRIIFEAQNLQYATPATVSRCGMLWFSDGVVPLQNLLSYAKHQLARKPVADVRGRRRSFDLQDDLVGVTAPQHTTTISGEPSPCIVSGQRGKTYNEYVIAQASVRVEEAADDHVVEEGPDHTPVDDALLGSTNHASTGDFASTLRTRQNTHPDCQRVQDALLAKWSDAFEAGGLLETSIRLVTSSPQYKEAHIMELSTLQIVESILALLLDGVWKTFCAEREGGNALSAAVINNIADRVMQHAIFWGLCAGMPHTTRTRLADDLKFTPSVATSGPATMLDVEVDHLSGEWRSVLSRVKATEVLAEQVGANDTVIPTVDTCRHEDLLGAWLGAGRSALLCGPPGSGKTMSITAVLNNLPEYEAVFLNFSSGTTVDVILKALAQYCTTQSTARGLVMAPSSGKKLLLFCDEINLPALNQYGTQVVLQLLRQLVERGGFFRPRDNAWVMIENIQIVGACNPPTDPGRVPLSLRFLRWAPVLFVDFPTPNSLDIIYGTYCRAILKFNPKLCEDAASGLAKAMVSTYRASQERFTTALQAHYLYSPRELSRWSRAIYEGIHTWGDSEKSAMRPESLIRLAIHEGLRVFSDRLVSADERSWTDATLDSCFQEAFPGQPASVYARPMLYSTLLSPAYTDSSRDALRKLLTDKLDAFCEEEVSVPLVVYDDVVDHVVRIDRVLRQPLGHVLIAGSSGVGKTILSRLVAWLRGFRVFWLKVHRDYTLEDFEEDLRTLLRRAGCGRERICFIFDESNILQPSFLEYMNALLASGEVPGLFEGDEWQKLMQEIREAIHVNTPAAAGAAGGNKAASGAAGGSPSKIKQVPNTPTAATAASAAATAVKDAYVDTTSEAQLYRWFLQNVKEYLHVVFTINPSSGEFSSRTVASPALFNRCTIDWLGDWEVDTLTQIAEERLKSLSLRASSAFNYTAARPNGALLNKDGKEVKLTQAEEEEEASKRSTVASAICQIHQINQQVNTLLRSRQANQGTFITPRHFSDFVRHFVSLYSEQCIASTDQLRHFRGGLLKLDETSKDVAAQQNKLRANEQLMAESSVRAQAMLERIITETDIARKEKSSAEELRQQLQAEQDRIDVEAKEVREELAEAEPALKDAELALATVKPEYLREIRAYTTPPPMVKRVLEAVCALMGEKNSDDWDILKNYIRKEDFIASVKGFLPDEISENARDRVGAMMKDSKFTVEAAYRASKAAGPLLQWVFAQVKFSGIFKRIAPVREKILKLTAAREVKVKALNATEKEINANEASLQQLKTEYQATTQEISDLKQQTAIVATKCERATTIISQLMGERSRWEEAITNFDDAVHTVLGDCLLSAAFLAYMGFYDEHTRQHVLLPRWMECVSTSHEIDVRPHLSVVDYLVSPNQRIEWEQNALPKDRLCLENATIIHRSKLYPLLIDPDGSAANFLQRQYAQHKVSTASFSRPGYLKQLEMAVRFGYPIIIEDAEALDPAVAPLLNHEVRRHGGRYITRVGAQDVDLSPTFKLFLRTRDPNYQPAPDLAGQVCVVNFTVTQSSLQSQCLHRIILHERPDIEAKRTDLLNAQGAYRHRLRVLEQDLLTSIASAEGSLLDNDKLIESLTQLKDEATSIEQDIASSDTSMALIERVEGRYRPVAAVTSRIFFALKRFAELSCFYRYDVQFVFRALDDALPSPTATTAASGLEEDNEEAAGTRIQLLLSNVFYLFHQRAVRGMFQEDHLVLALRLAQLRSSVALSETGAAVSTNDWVSEDEWEWLLDAVHNTGLIGAPSLSTSSSEQLPAALLEPGVLAAGKQGRAVLYALLQKPAFHEVKQSLHSEAAAWEAVLQAPSPVEMFSTLPASCFPKGAAELRKAFLMTLLMFFTRRDCFVNSAFRLLSLFFEGDDAVRRGFAGNTDEPNTTTKSFFASQSHNLSSVLSELSSTTPMVLVSTAGYDASGRVEQAARDAKVVLRVVAMGSAESTVYGDQSISEGMRTGCWVLLKNVHLARMYVDAVEKKVHFEAAEGRVHAQFRLFLTVERGPKEDPHDVDLSARITVLPITILERAVTVALEPPPGMKSSLQQTYGAMDDGSNNNNSIEDKSNSALLPRTDAQTVLMQRVYMAAAWLHAVVTERLFYVPMGWSQNYEFSDIDFARVAQAVDAWSTQPKAAADKPSVSWDALQRIVAITVYGGKVGNEFDQYVLTLFASHILNASVLDGAHQFVQQHPKADARFAPPMLDAAMQSRSDMLQWIRSLPDGLSNPQWSGLPSGVARMAMSQLAVAAVDRLAIVQSSMEDDAALHTASSPSSPIAAASLPPQIPRWAMKAKSFCGVWNEQIRTSLRSVSSHAFVVSAVRLDPNSETFNDKVESTASSSTSPLVLAAQREAVALLAILQTIDEDISGLQLMCAGSRKPTAAHRRLVDEITTDRVPSAWVPVSSATNTQQPVSAWLADIVSRADHLLRMVNATAAGKLYDMPLSLGMLLFPGAFLTASKQECARELRVPLEQLLPQVTLLRGSTAASGGSQAERARCLRLTGITMVSACVNGSGKGELIHASSAVTSLSSKVDMLWSWTPSASARSYLSLPAQLEQQDAQSNTALLPLYVAADRSELIAVVKVPIEGEAELGWWYERGVCFAAWSPVE